MYLHCCIAVVKEAQSCEVDPESGFLSTCLHCKLILNRCLKKFPNFLTIWACELCDFESEQLKDIRHSFSVCFNIWKINDARLLSTEVQIAIDAVMIARNYNCFPDIWLEEAIRLALTTLSLDNWSTWYTDQRVVVLIFF